MARHHKKHSNCPNCGLVFRERDNFCPQCGQENHDLNVPVTHLIGEVVENTLHLDSKSLRTLTILLFRPGLLTAQFNQGKRKSFVPPVRLYVFVSVLFFFLLSVHSGEGGGEKEPGAKDNFSVSFYGINSGELRGLSEPQRDSVMQAHNIGLTPLNRKIVQNLQRIATGGKSAFTHLLLKNISYMMFLLMPWFGVLLLLFHKGRVHYYVECLIHSVHLHSFLFVLFTVVLALQWIFPFWSLLLPAAAIVAFYFYGSLKTVYGQSVIRTFWKTVVLGVFYLLSMIACFLLAVNVSLLVF